MYVRRTDKRSTTISNTQMSNTDAKKPSKAKVITAKKNELVDDIDALLDFTVRLYGKYTKAIEQANGVGSVPDWETSITLESKTKTKSGREIHDRESTVMKAAEVPLFLARLGTHMRERVAAVIDAGKRAKTFDENGNVVPRAPGGLVLTGLYKKEFAAYFKALVDSKVVNVSAAEADVITKKNLCNITIARRVLRMDWLAQPGRKTEDKVMSATPLMKKHLAAILAECTKEGMDIEAFKYAQLGKLSAKCAVDKKNMSDADKAKNSGDEASNDLLVSLYKKIRPADATDAAEETNGHENGHDEAPEEESVAPGEDAADEEEVAPKLGPVSAPVDMPSSRRTRTRARPTEAN